ncbi:MAG: mannose-6-phosphate isomerase, partial [Oscillospiraceae bacterium]
RQLHIDKAVDVTKLCPAKPYPVTASFEENGAVKRLLSKCEYFTVYSVDIEKEACFNADETSFECILNLEGEVKLACGENEITLKKGETAFIPAGCGKYTISGKCKAVLTRID